MGRTQAQRSLCGRETSACLSTPSCLPGPHSAGHRHLPTLARGLQVKVRHVTSKSQQRAAARGLCSCPRPCQVRRPCPPDSVAAKQGSLCRPQFLSDCMEQATSTLGPGQLRLDTQCAQEINFYSCKPLQLGSACYCSTAKPILNNRILQ